MIRIVLALAALLLLAPVAQAASFDCSKASTSIEKAVCASADLSRQDEVLAKAYATAIGGLSADAVNQVKATQHDWLDYASRACSDDAQPIGGTYSADQTQCLVGTYKARVQSLEASRMLGGYRFYPYERYLIEQDTDADSNSFNKVATKHYETVKIDGTDELATAFNAMTEQLRVDTGNSSSDGDTALFVKGTDGLTTGDTTDDIDITTTVKSVSDYRISLETTGSWYGHGAAHPNYYIEHVHFLVQEKRMLAAGDIFTGADWQATLGKLVTDKVKAQLGDAYFADAEADIPKSAADPTRWDFSDAGLIVQFQPYEVASYADGAVTVTIPWDQLSDIMTENGQAIASY